ncbi:MAG: hypothetical protein K2X04_02840 [Burkholderiales bacterium]|nr:hypothetical protein [Burkholderiales bacterium]
MNLKEISLKTFVTILSFFWIILLYFANNSHFNYSSWAELINYSIKHWIIVSILLTWLVVSIIFYTWLPNIYNWLSTDNIIVTKIYPVYTEYMPSYLGIIFVALSINTSTTTLSIILLAFLFILFYMCNIAFLNPIAYVLGWRMYKIETDYAGFLLLSKRKNIKLAQPTAILIKKLDEYLFIDTGDNE